MAMSFHYEPGFPLCQVLSLQQPRQAGAGVPVFQVRKLQRD